MSRNRAVATLDIYLKSGQTVTVPVTDWSCDSYKTGEITSFTWTHPDSEHRIVQIDLREISCIVRRPA